MAEAHAAKRAKLEPTAMLQPAAELATAAQDEAAVPAADSGGSKRQQRAAPLPPKKKAKQVVMPTLVPPPQLPADPAAWGNAVLLIDKPKDWTSFDVCGKLRGALAGLLRCRPRELKGEQAEHAALGLCMGRGMQMAVRNIPVRFQRFMAMQKEYTGTLRLGEGTPTYDAESEVEERLPWEHITDVALAGARRAFLGDIQQLPPMHSAIRVDGQRLYEAARKGREVERQPRAVTGERAALVGRWRWAGMDVFDLERDTANPQDVQFRVRCSKGTYIRSLAFDLGRKLDSAAHLTALRREAIGEHRVDAAWQLSDLVESIGGARAAAKAARDAARGGEPAAAGEAGAAGGEAAEAPQGGQGDAVEGAGTGVPNQQGTATEAELK
eukprot:scaffold20.g7677.t1